MTKKYVVIESSNFDPEMKDTCASKEKLEMKKYSFANVIIERCGGGCHMFYGNLIGGNWFFICDSWDYSFITKNDLSKYLYDDDFYEKCITDSVKELEDDNHWDFKEQVLNYIVEHGHPEFVGYDE